MRRTSRLDLKRHALADYAVCLALFLFPALFVFPQSATGVAYVMGALFLVTALVTRYPLGLVKALPFSVHRVWESMLAFTWIGMPWLFRFADDAPARNLFVGAGLLVLLLAAVSDRTHRPAPAQPARNERRAAAPDRRTRILAVIRERRSGLDRRLAVGGR